MKYTINQIGLTTIEKKRKKLSVFVKAFPLITIIGLPGLWSERLFPRGSFDVGAGIIVFFYFLIGNYFLCYLPYKNLTSIARNIIHQIDIDGGNCVFAFSMDRDKYTAPMCLKIGNIEIIPADKNESISFKGKTFIVFNDLGEKAYFIDEYFDDAALILNQLGITSKSPRYNEFLTRINIEGKSLKNTLLYKIPIINIVFFVFSFFAGITLNISLMSIFLSLLLVLVMILRLNIYPLIRKAKVMNHMIKKIEIKDNYCYLYCNNIFENEDYYEAYELGDISIGEREVYQERIFNTEKFMVLNVPERKFYLHGDLLSEYEPVFKKINVAQ